MNIHEILKFSKKYFPLVIPEKLEFLEYYESIVAEYVDKVSSSEDLFEVEKPDESLYIELGRDRLVEELRQFSKLIVRAIRQYLDGHPNLAFKSIDEAMQTIRHTSGRYKYIGGSGIVGNGSVDFFRIRLKDTRQAIPKQEMFHVPFSLRRKIKTNRYSIPGLPCLYLSNSIYVAWTELDKPRFDLIHASRMTLRDTFVNFDLTTDAFCSDVVQDRFRNDVTQLNSAVGKLFMFPLIVACSMRVKPENRGDIFKPEYIVPQLMLQWIAQKSTYMGIAYTSSHVDTTNPNFKGRFTNYVLPVCNQEGEYCSRLKRMFNMTESLSAELYELNKNPTPAATWGGPDVLIHRDIEAIEVVKGSSSEYGKTKFGSLENALCKHDADKIDF